MTKGLWNYFSVLPSRGKLSPLIIQSLADCSNWCHNHDTILDFLHAKASNLIFICCFPSAIRGLHSSTSL
ncbi:hypothetical protein QQP08_016009 [Theobroma cacao]|nr:hypothetical protein QQP08_016009 [Theobroma cacao]